MLEASPRKAGHTGATLDIECELLKAALGFLPHASGLLGSNNLALVPPFASESLLFFLSSQSWVLVTVVCPLL